MSLPATPMLVACLDTSTLSLSCALCEIAAGAARLIAERTERAPPKPVMSGGRRAPRVEEPGPRGPTGGHGGRLPGVLQDLLATAGLELSAVEGYAVGLGPGSFTGLRIGLATWKGLAYAGRRPLAGCSSLAAMALAVAPAAGGALLVPLLDAKKGEVYAGFYRGEGASVRSVAPDAALAPAALQARLVDWQGSGEMPLVFGEGVDVLGEVRAAMSVLPTEVRTPPALAVGALCAGGIGGAAYDAAHLFALEPRYVRPSEAELKFPHGQGPGAGMAG